MTTKAILNSSEGNEWYTPAPYIEATREVLGGIELDPASCAEAQETVKAAHYFTQEEVRTGRGSGRVAVQCDGLTASWYARSVFLNPPYGTSGGLSNQRLWSQKLIAAYRGTIDVGNIGCAILLVNACTTTRAVAGFPLYLSAAPKTQSVGRLLQRSRSAYLWPVMGWKAGGYRAKGRSQKTTHWRS